MSGKRRSIVSDINSSRICIDDYQHGIFSGRIYHLSLEQPVQFHGFLSLIKEMDQYLNNCDFPQVSMQLRSFITKEDNSNTEERAIIATKAPKDYIRGKLATFRVRVMFRQNATWQGSIRWLEADQEERFRSALELMMLMDSCFETRRDTTNVLPSKESVIS